MQWWLNTPVHNLLLLNITQQYNSHSTCVSGGVQSCYSEGLGKSNLTSCSPSLVPWGSSVRSLALTQKGEGPEYPWNNSDLSTITLWVWMVGCQRKRCQLWCSFFLTRRKFHFFEFFKSSVFITPLASVMEERLALESSHIASALGWMDEVMQMLPQCITHCYYTRA